MRRLGQYVAEARNAERDIYLSLPGRVRLEDSLRKAHEFLTPEIIERCLTQDDPSVLYTRARALGLAHS